MLELRFISAEPTKEQIILGGAELF